jgi:hypothetical protein
LCDELCFDCQHVLVCVVINTPPNFADVEHPETDFEVKEYQQNGLRILFPPQRFKQRGLV